MGRSRGRLTTEIHAVVDADGRPIGVDLTAGQAHDSRMAEPMLRDIATAQSYWQIGVRHQLSSRVRQRKTCLGKHPGETKPKRKLPFSSWGYRQRNQIERFFNKLKQFRGIATRYDKDARNLLAAIKLVATRIWIRSL